MNFFIKKVLLLIALYHSIISLIITPERQQELMTIVNKSGALWKPKFYGEKIFPENGLLIPPENWTNNKYKKLKSNIPANLPKEYDLRKEYPYCDSISHIYDQGECGSCYAVATSSVMTDRICISTKGSKKPKVSSIDIVSCCKDCGRGCGGGLMYSSYLYWERKGIPTGGDYGDKSTCKPYPFPKCDHHMNGTYGPCPTSPAKTPQCVDKCIDEYGKKVDDDLSFGNETYLLHEDENEIMNDIYQHGSVSASFAIFEDFFLYKEGIYHSVSGKYCGSHAMRIIGWGEDNGNKYWIVANSWNEEWGEKGFVRVLKGNNECGIEDDVVAGTPKL